MSKGVYHTNDCKLCAPLIDASKKKFGREPDLKEFVPLLYRWNNTVKQAEELVNALFNQQPSL